MQKTDGLTGRYIQKTDTYIQTDRQGIAGFGAGRGVAKSIDRQVNKNIKRGRRRIGEHERDFSHL
jgi:hypothetical protein